MQTTASLSYDPIDLSRLSFWDLPFEEREARFAELRRDRPVSYHRPIEVDGDPDVAGYHGFWALAGHREITEVSHNPELFCSSEGVMIEDLPPEHRAAVASIIEMDAPRHSHVRRIVTSAFSPKTVRRLEELISERAAEVVAALVAEGEGDFARYAGMLPAQTIADIMGVPDSMLEQVMHAVDGIVGWLDPEVQAGRDPVQTRYESIVSISQASAELAAQRRRNPSDDVVTALVSQKVDGAYLTDAEIGAFFVLLAVAGSDTTKQATAFGAKALHDHPEQRDLLLTDLPGHIGTAAEEMVRWASPVMTFRRTATQDTELGGRSIKAGEKLVLYYCSGNRDESVFDRPDRFDVTRNPNPHVGFGGRGPHYCLGTFLARAQLRAFFTELLQRAPGISLGEPAYLGGYFMRAITRMSYRA